MKRTGVLLVVLLTVAACARAGASGPAARQTLTLEVVPVVEVGPSRVTEAHPADRSTAREEVQEDVSLALSPEGFGGKVTVTSEPGAAVEVDVETSLGSAEYPRAAVRLTITDP